METGSTVEDLVFVPIKIVKQCNLRARLEIERSKKKKKTWKLKDEKPVVIIL